MGKFVTMTDIAELLRGRWSPQEFDGLHNVSEADVQLLLEAARWAPSARNRQPWRFVVGRRNDATWQRLRPFVSGFSDWALDASVLVVNIYASRVPEMDFALYDVGGAVAHMSIQGEALGLHARQFATFDREGLSREFGIVKPHIAVTMTAFGVVPEGVQAGERTRDDLETLRWVERP